MPIFTYQSGVWNSLKGLFFNSASTTYSNAISGWVYDGASWRISYPSFPINTVLPVLTGVVAFNNTITVNTGTWNSEAVVAVNPSTNFAYQWLRDGVDIPSATTNSYFCVAADVGKQLSCRVTAINGRGGTPVVTASQLVVPRITVAPKYTDTTIIPASVSSFTSNQGTNPYDWTLSWVNGLNTTSLALTQSGTGGSIVYTSPNTSATGNSNGTAPAVVTVTSTNNSCKANIDTFAAIGATGYRIKLDSGAEIPLGSTITSYEFTGVSVGSHTVTVVPYFNITPGVGNSVTFTSVAKTNSAQRSITVKELGKIDKVTLTDSTIIPAAPTTSFLEQAGQSWELAWTAVPNATSYSASATTGTTTAIQFFAGNVIKVFGTASGGAVTASATATNSNKQITASWTQVVGATTYYARLDSGVETDIGITSSVTYPISDTNNHTVTVTPYSGTYRGQSTQSAAGSAENKTGSAGSGSGTWAVADSISPSGTISTTIGTEVSWTTSGQEQRSYSLSSSPTTTLNGATGAFAKSRTFTAVFGTSYTFNVFVYKLSSQNGPFTTATTTFNVVRPLPSVPGTPTLTYLRSGSTVWFYSATWAASTGGSPITYQILGTGAFSGSQLTRTGVTSGGEFSLPQTDSLWSVQVRASNDGGVTYSELSGSSGQA
jgi:hypothetical protein